MLVLSFLQMILLAPGIRGYPELWEHGPRPHPIRVTVPGEGVSPGTTIQGMPSRKPSNHSLLSRTRGLKVPWGALAWCPRREYVTAYLSGSWSPTLAPTSLGRYVPAWPETSLGLHDSATIAAEDYRLGGAGPPLPFYRPASILRQDYHQFSPDRA